MCVQYACIEQGHRRPPAITPFVTRSRRASAAQSAPPASIGEREGGEREGGEREGGERGASIDGRGGGSALARTVARWIASSPNASSVTARPACANLRARSA